VSFLEKSAWVMISIIVFVYGRYFLVVFNRIGDFELDEIPYRAEMLWALITLVVLVAASHIVLAIASPRDAEQRDERDKEINRFGEYVGGYVLGAATVVALGMTIAEVEHFWIANAILAGLVLSEITSGLTKVTLYRRGM
jgi:hypothetical protein